MEIKCSLHGSLLAWDLQWTQEACVVFTRKQHRATIPLPPPPHSPCLSSLLGKKRQPWLETAGSSENMEPIWLLKAVAWLSVSVQGGQLVSTAY